MEIRNRLFPYPVLCEETDDYNDSSTFEVKMTPSENLNDIAFVVDFLLCNEALENLIRRGEASYVIHIECSNTSYRRVMKSDLKQISFFIPKSSVNKEIQFVGMIVANSDITDFYSEELNEDYFGLKLNFDKASILAYQNLPRIVVTKDYEELAMNESIFSIIRLAYDDTNENHPLDIDLSDERIKIRVDAKTYDTYIKFRQSTYLAMSMFILPALLYMIDTVREEESCASYETKAWFIRMSKFFKAQDRDFVEELTGENRKNALELAQEMLQNPIGKAYRELQEMEE